MLDSKDLEKIKEIIDDSIEVKARAIVQESEFRLTKKIEDETAFLAKITNESFRLVDKRFDVLENRFDVLENRFNVLENRFGVLENKFDKLEARTENIEKSMITKPYFDDQIKDLKGDFVLRIKKQDNRFNLVIEMLHNKDVFSKKDILKLDELGLSKIK